MNASNPLRFSQIDFLRAVAVLLVIGNHMMICPAETSGFANWLTSSWSRGGWAGVDLFFVLSGFLISGLLFSEYKKRGTLDIKRFLVRRGFKIYPAFWFFLLVSLIILAVSGEQFYRRGFFDEFVFIQNFQPAIWDHTWSLAVEEHFYIFLSFLFFLLLLNKKDKNPFDSIPELFALLAVFCLLARCLTTVYAHEFRYGIMIEATHLRIDSLFFGVFLGFLWHFRGLSESAFLQKNKNYLALAGILCFTPVFVFELDKNVWIWTLWLTVLYLGGGSLLLALLKSDISENIFIKFFAGLGKYSYSVYLWNLPVHFWLAKYTNLAVQNWFLYAFFYLAGTLLLGIGTAKLIEYPFLKLRDRVFPSPASALKTA